MDTRLEHLCASFPEFAGNFTPPWGLPTRLDFEALSKRYGCEFPPSYVSFQTEYAAKLPIPDAGFRWATPGLEPYLSLETTIVSAREWGVAHHLVPFWDDEGNFFCFDTRRPSGGGEYPVVFWDHEAPEESPPPTCRDFVEWLSGRLEEWRRRRGR
jgi:hypothetical protein